jgi:predicted permease
VSRLGQDLRFGLRILAKSPAALATTVVSLALGIGANTTVFSFVNALLLRPLPVEQPERLVGLYSEVANKAGYGSFSYPDYLDIATQTESVFSGVVAYSFFGANLSGREAPALAFGELVSDNYFGVLGVVPRGRGFLPEEGRTPGGAFVVVVSDALWRSRFGADPTLLGRTIRLQGHEFTVVGIAPPGFEGTVTGVATGLWVPLTMRATLGDDSDLASRTDRRLEIAARLGPGVSIGQARAALSTLAGRLQQAYPATDAGREILAGEGVGRPEIRGALKSVAALLMGMALLVLAVACANVANVQLARSTARRREIATRVALGARPARIVRQLLTESMLLALLGGIAGLLLAYWATGALMTFRPELTIPVPISLRVTPDARVFAFTLLACVVSGGLFGVAPALQATRTNLVAALRDGERTGGGRRSLLRNALVVTQVSVSLVLLVGSGLFVASLRQARLIEPGIRTEGVVVAPLPLGLSGYSPTRAEAFCRRLLDSARALPGVDAAAFTSVVPLSATSDDRPVVVEGREVPAGAEVPRMNAAAVTPGYFQVLGIPILSGRDFGPQDLPSSAGVVIVNETFARQSWPGAEPLGRRLSVSGPAGPFLDVVGVAKDGKYRSLGEAPRPFVYLPLAQNPQVAVVNLLVHTSGDSASVQRAVMTLVRGIDADLPALNVSSLRDHIAVSLWPARMAAGALSALGLVALLLAAVGVYGTTAYAVNQRM